MMDLDRWQEIYLTLTHHKLRTSLTAFGVFWGIFMLVILLGAGTGLERGAAAGFGGHTNTIFIWSQGKTQIPYKGLNAGRWVRITDQDYDAIKRIPEVGLISEVNDLGGWQTAQYVVRKNNSGSFATRGTSPDAFQLGGYHIISGRAINALDFEEKRKVAVIGSEVRKILFDENEKAIGKFIQISGVNFKVIGSFRPSVTGSGGRNEAERIFVPNSTLRHTYNQTAHIGHIQVAPKPGFSAIDLEEKAKQAIMHNHRIHPDDTGVLGVWNAQKEFDKIQSLFAGIRAFSWVVAIGTVIAGVVGVGNIMLIVVKERTKEIGVRKALGATSSNIVLTIVQESLVLTLISGYFGLCAGVFALEGIAKLVGSQDGAIMFGKPDIDFTTAATALFALTVAGLLASVLPASKAARVDPIVALQDE